MSVNRHRPHILVLPEDDANRQLANGFLIEASVSTRQIHIEPIAGGWTRAVDFLESDLIPGMERYADEYIVLLIDFDGDGHRSANVLQRIPERMKDRIFVLGSLHEPEALRRAGLGSYEQIGRLLAEDCRDGTVKTWGHAQLRCNLEELERMRSHVQPILFPDRTATPRV